VAEAHSFAEAARQLDVASSVITVRIKQLEEHVQAPLFHRTTRHVRLTEVGEAYYKGLYDRYPTRNRWTFHKGEEAVELILPAALKSNSVHLLCDYALAGAGIVCVPTMTLAEPVLQGRLAPILTDYPLSSLTVSAVYPESHRHNLKVRLFLDYLVTAYTGEPEWGQQLAAAGVVLPPG
jgi:DNA-binding transcriptional LysR family regulator